MAFDQETGEVYLGGPMTVPEGHYANIADRIDALRAQGGHVVDPASAGYQDDPSVELAEESPEL